MRALDPGQYPGLSLEAFLDEVAAPAPAPGGGSVAAVTVALAAALCSMAARKSAQDPAGAVADLADERRRQALALATEDAVAYAKVIDAQRNLTAVEGQAPAVNLPPWQDALSAAADVPMALAEIAAEVAGIADTLVAGGNPNLVGDSLAAALLASAAAEAAAALVAINLAARSASSSGDGRASSSGDGRAGRASTLASVAAAAAARARAGARARLGER